MNSNTSMGMIKNIGDNITLSVVIPVYCGEKTIALLVDDLVDQLKEESLEIILVNDVSPDNSHDVCMSIQSSHPEVVVYIKLAKNTGEHNAVMAGLRYASGEYVVTMDDDYQNPPSEVKKLLSTARLNDYDVVYSYYQIKRDSWFRNLGSRFNNSIASFLLSKPNDLYLSSFRCMNGFLVTEIIKYEGPFSYVDGLILHCTSNIGSVETMHNKRSDGRSSYTFKKLLHLWLNMFVNFSITPLRISSVLGLLLSVFGIFLTLYIILEKFLVRDMPMGFPSLFIGIMIFSGVQLIILGVMGEYVGRLLLSINRTAQYTIREIHPRNQKLKNDLQK